MCISSAVVLKTIKNIDKKTYSQSSRRNFCKNEWKSPKLSTLFKIFLTKAKSPIHARKSVSYFLKRSKNKLKKHQIKNIVKNDLGYSWRRVIPIGQYVNTWINL